MHHQLTSPFPFAATITSNSSMTSFPVSNPFPLQDVYHGFQLVGIGQGQLFNGDGFALKLVFVHVFPFLIYPKTYFQMAKEHWDGFYKAADSVYQIVPADILALASLVDAWSEYQEIRKYLQEEGYTYDSYEGPKLKPEYWLMSEACKRAFEGMNRFGMTPMARAEMGI